jgi:glyoxylase-like metal-dependent hydrolase (beta-lactamase superfamily II)
MIFLQMLEEKMGCATYLVGCGSGGTCAIIDPREGPEPYLRAAADRGLRIAHVIDTHVHGDHISGARALAAAAGAPYYLHESALAAFPCEKLKEGTAIDVGQVHLTALDTPGHTTDSVCLLVEDRSRGAVPWFVLTGDTLMVGDVGRPDLVLDDSDPNRPVLQAAMLYDSIFGKLLTLEDGLEIFPSHFGASPCGGVNMNRKASSTVGFERKFNLALRLPSRDAFVRYVRATLKPQPEKYQDIKAKNLGLL